MVGCSALNCNNSTERGFKMKRFPRDENRRLEWMKNVNRPNWTPTDHCCLCEVHFEPMMWERRADMKPKLKPNAVPTIFGYYLKDKTFLPEEKIENCEDNSNDSTNCDMKTDSCEEEEDNMDDISTLIQSEELMLVKRDKYVEMEQKLEKQQNQIEKLQRIIEKNNQNHNSMRQYLKRSRLQIKLLEEKIAKDKYRKALCEILTQDQIDLLLTRKFPNTWSNNTIQRAKELRIACGESGYEHIRKLKIPLPDLEYVNLAIKEGS